MLALTGVGVSARPTATQASRKLMTMMNKNVRRTQLIGFD
jgi:hypothetical protein